MKNAMIFENPVVVGAMSLAPTPVVNGAIYFDTTLMQFQFYENGTWRSIYSPPYVAANTALSNLTSPTAINQDLLPAGSYNLGSSVSAWASVYVQGAVYSDSLVSKSAPSNYLMQFIDNGSSSFYQVGSSSSYPLLVGLQRATDPSAYLLAGMIYYNTATNIFRYYNGSIWVDMGAGAGANQSLSNLISTSINQSLVPDSDGTRNLGTSLIRWSTAYCDSLDSPSIYNDNDLSIQSSTGAVAIEGSSLQVKALMRQFATNNTAKYLETEYFYDISMIGNTTVPTVISELTYDTADCRGMIIEMSLVDESTGEAAVGQMMIVNRDAIEQPSLTADFTDTDGLNFDFTADLNSGLIRVKYTNLLTTDISACFFVRRFVI